MAQDDLAEARRQFRNALQGEIDSGRPPSWPSSVYVGGQEMSVEDAVTVGMAEPGLGSGIAPPGPEGDAQLDMVRDLFREALHDEIYEQEYAEDASGRFAETINQRIAQGLDLFAAPLANIATGRAFGPAENLFQSPIRDLMVDAGLTVPEGFEHEGYAASAGGLVGETAMALPMLYGGAAAGKILPQFTERGARMLGPASGAPAEFVDYGMRTVAGKQVPRMAQGAGTATANPFTHLLSGVGQQMTRNPGMAVGAEMGLSGMAGMGGEFAADTFGEEYRGLGELGGGFAPFMAGNTYRLGRAATFPIRWPIAKSSELLGLTALARNAMPSWLRNLGPRGVRSRAEDIFERAAANPDSALESLRTSDVLDEAPLSPAQLSDDRGLVQLENTVMGADAARRDQQLAQIGEVDEASRQALRDLGAIETQQGLVPEGYVPFDDYKPENVIRILRELISAARARAEERIASLGPQVTREQGSRILAQELLGAREASRMELDRAFEAIPFEDTLVDTNQLKSDFMDLWDSVSDEGKKAGWIPSYAKSFLHPDGPDVYKGETTLRNLYDLRSVMLDIADEAAAAPGGGSRNRNALKIADMVLEAMGVHRNRLGAGRYTSPSAEALDNALDMARIHEDTFSRGPIGRLMRGSKGVESFGEGEDLVLDSLFGSSGSQARHNYDYLMRALDGSPQARDRVEDAVKLDFVDSLLNEDGEVVASRYNSWKRKWSELLQRLPELEVELDNAVREGKAFQDLADRNVTRTSILLNQDPEDFVRSIKQVQIGQLPEAVDEVMRIVNSDPTGKGLEGLRRIFNDYLLKGSASRRSTHLGNQDFLDSDKLRELISDDKMQIIMRKVYNEQQLSRLNTILETLRRNQMSMELGKAQADVWTDSPNLLAAILGRISAVHAGRVAARGSGVGQLTLSGYFAQLAKNIQTRMAIDPAQRLASDAVLDPELFAALLAREDSPQAVKRRARRVLRAWALGVVAEDTSEAFLPDLEEEE